MKKTVHVLSILSAALQGIALLLFLIIVIFQRQFKLIMSSDPEIIATFNFPITQTLYLLCVMGAILLVCLAAFLKGRSVWAEILGIVMLGAVCTLLYRLGNTLETTLYVAPRGAMYLASFSSLQTLTGFANSVASIASALALVTCGMSIAVKKLTPAA